MARWGPFLLSSHIIMHSFGAHTITWCYSVCLLLQCELPASRCIHSFLYVMLTLLWDLMCQLTQYRYKRIIVSVCTLGLWYTLCWVGLFRDVLFGAPRTGESGNEISYRTKRACSPEPFAWYDHLAWRIPGCKFFGDHFRANIKPSNDGRTYKSTN